MIDLRFKRFSSSIFSVLLIFLQHGIGSYLLCNPTICKVIVSHLGNPGFYNSKILCILETTQILMKLNFV